MPQSAGLTGFLHWRNVFVMALAILLSMGYIIRTRSMRDVPGPSGLLNCVPPQSPVLQPWRDSAVPNPGDSLSGQEGKVT